MGMTVRGLIVVGMVGVTGCATQHVLPPALPEEPAVQIPYALPETGTPPPVPSVGPIPTPPPSMHPVIQPTPEEGRAFQTDTPKQRSRQGRKGRVEHEPQSVVDTANRQALVVPNRSRYGYGTSVSQRYPWWPGRLFEVFTAPSHPTTLRLPVGEKLAKGFAPTLNPELWTVGIVTQGEDEQAFDSIVVRPATAGQEATTPLLLRSGKALYVRLRSFEKTSMVEVTWEAPEAPEALQKAQGVLTRAHPTNARMAVIPPAEPGTARAHGEYTIKSLADHTPAWMPRRAWDDGSTTYILFQQSLQFTNAPAVFGRTTRRGSPQLVQFTAYDAHGQATYIVRGLWPLLELKGDGMTVEILRGPTKGPQHAENQ